MEDVILYFTLYAGCVHKGNRRGAIGNVPHNGKSVLGEHILHLFVIGVIKSAVVTGIHAGDGDQPDIRGIDIVGGHDEPHILQRYAERGALKQTYLGVRAIKGAERRKRGYVRPLWKYGK